MRVGVSIVWDHFGNYFQTWSHNYNGDGKLHAETIAKKINGTVFHIEENDVYDSCH